MLIEFSVENYRSFKDKVTFSMEKGIGDENEINIFKFENLELLKSSAIYGANASGKTNLIRAFTTAIMMIRQSNIIPVGGRWNTIVPFILDEKSKPSEQDIRNSSQEEFTDMFSDLKKKKNKQIQPKSKKNQKY